MRKGEGARCTLPFFVQRRRLHISRRLAAGVLYKKLPCELLGVQTIFF